MSLEYGPFENSGEEEQLRDILSQCFNFPVNRWDPYVRQVERDNFRRVKQAGRVVGGLGIFQMGQWFGGVSVPMGGIAAVGVPPELRASGVARDLMIQTLRELHRSGVPLSALYASTQRLYRKVGYEQAGMRCTYTLPTRSIGSVERELSLRPVEATKHGSFHEVYRQRAVESSGNLDRNEGIWSRVVQTKDEPIYGYLVGPEERPEGYLIYIQQRRDDGSQDLIARDLVATTPRAARTLWSFVADHRSIVRTISWEGPAKEPLLCLLPEQDAQIKHMERWLLRIVEVEAALRRRGYPVDVNAELHLEVTDEVIPENEGRFLLRVKGGKAEVTRGGNGEMRLHVRGLAPLYSGFLAPNQLRQLGWLEAPPPALASATLLFSGPEPWMCDGF